MTSWLAEICFAVRINPAARYPKTGISMHDGTVVTPFNECCNKFPMRVDTSNGIGIDQPVYEISPTK